jgi:hypothetical protein
MKINFTQYILLGVFGVFVLANTMSRVMQIDTMPYKGRDKTILFFSKNISQEGKQFGPRILTFWNISHVMYHTVGAYLFPDKAIILWTLGVFWEILESGVGYMNPLDIVWNTIGIFMGLWLARLKKQKP